jgi:hypothetical protein
MTLYPKLPEKGEQEAMALIESFKNRLKDVASDVISDLYTAIAPFIESDSWTNYRNDLMAGLCDYKRAKSSYDFKEVRRKIFQEYRAEIIEDLNKDLLAEIKSLKKQLETERRLRQDRY